ncbi:hypothetical protein J2T07_000439 [Luteibacter jiangsuensis]|uniref:Uncharacterized protein n=1 Tax=Luteibacter jiangsuensis TaxID=637577 RepID=A0ABT9STG5_9GAMM|nr:hypothetical protein [Luteibacter jiangsuensis]
MQLTVKIRQSMNYSLEGVDLHLSRRRLRQPEKNCRDKIESGTPCWLVAHRLLRTANYVDQPRFQNLFEVRLVKASYGGVEGIRTEVQVGMGAYRLSTYRSFFSRVDLASSKLGARSLIAGGTQATPMCNSDNDQTLTYDLVNCEDSGLTAQTVVITNDSHNVYGPICVTLRLSISVSVTLNDGDKQAGLQPLFRH